VADIRRLIGDQIRDLRKKKGLSQMELGSKAKLHYTYVGAVERAEKNISVVTLDKIGRALGVSLNEIFSFSKAAHDPDKMRALMIKELNKADPQILEIAFDLLKRLNAFRVKPRSRKRSK
jgi:transcriptional regulator with XRE-family HTH domain